MDLTSKLMQDIDNLEISITEFSERYCTDKSILNDELRQKVQSLVYTLRLFQNNWTKDVIIDSSLLFHKGFIDPEINMLELNTTVKNTIDSKSVEKNHCDELYPQIEKRVLKTLQTFKNFSELAIILNMDDVYDCLICRNILLKKDLIPHCKGKRHNANMAEPASVKALTVFHNIFESDTTINKINKYSAYPVSESKIECNSCKTVIKVDNVKKHFLKKSHVESKVFKLLLKYWDIWKRSNKRGNGALNELTQNQLNKDNKKDIPSPSSSSSTLQKRAITNNSRANIININQVKSSGDKESPKKKKALESTASSLSPVISRSSSEIPCGNDMNDILKTHCSEIIIDQMTNSHKEQAAKGIINENKKKETTLAIINNVEFSKNFDETKSIISNAVAILKTRYPETVIDRMSSSHKEHAAREIQKELYECGLKTIPNIKALIEDKTKATKTIGAIPSMVAVEDAKETLNEIKYEDHGTRGMNQLHPQNSLTLLTGVQNDNCLICQISIVKGIKNTINHMKGTRHKKELKNEEKMSLLEPFLKFCDSILSDKDELFSMNKYLIFPESVNSIYCKACDRIIEIDNLDNFLKHLVEPSHVNSDAYVVLKSYFKKRNWNIQDYSSVSRENDSKESNSSSHLMNKIEISSLSEPPDHVGQKSLTKNENSESIIMQDNTRQSIPLEALSGKRKLKENFNNSEPPSTTQGSCFATANLMELLSGLETSKSNSSTVNNSPSNSLENINFSETNICENAIETVLEAAENKENSNKKIKCNNLEDISIPIDKPHISSTLNINAVQDSILWLEIKDCDIYNRLFFTLEHSIYTCNLCQEKIEIIGKVASICEHIQSDKHKNNLKNAVISHRFYCHPCNFLFYDETWYEIHMDSSWHRKRLITFCEMNKDEVIFRETCCRKCGVVTFGDPLLLPEHQHATYKKIEEDNKIGAEIFCLGCSKIINFSREYSLIHFSDYKSNIAERFTAKLEELVESGEIKFEFVGNKRGDQRGALMTELTITEINSADQYSLCHFGLEVQFSNFQYTQYKKLQRNVRKKALPKEKPTKKIKKNLGAIKNTVSDCNIVAGCNIITNIDVMQNDTSPKTVTNNVLELSSNSQVGLQETGITTNSNESCSITILKDEVLNKDEPMETDIALINSELTSFQLQVIPDMVMNLDKCLTKIIADKPASKSLLRTYDADLNYENASLPMIYDDDIKSDNSSCDKISSNNKSSSVDSEVNIVESSNAETTDVVQDNTIATTMENTILKSTKEDVLGSDLTSSFTLEELWQNVPLKEFLHKPLFEFNDKMLLCKMCNANLSATTSESKILKSLMQHIQGRNHQKNITNCFHMRYLCDLCEIATPIMGNYQLHKSSEGHKERLKVFSEQHGNSNPFVHECSICFVTDIFSKPNKSHEHYPFDLSKLPTKKPIKRKQSKSDKKKMDSIQKIIKLLENERHFCKMSENMLRTARKIMSDNMSDLKTCTALEAAVGVFYPTCKAYPFGSRVSGLATSFNSDLDVFLDTGGMYDGTRAQDSASQAYLVNNCNDILRRKGCWDHLNPITKARTPILQAFNIDYKVDCDISFRHGLSVQNTILLKTLLADQPIARRMILVLKFWAKTARFVFLGGYILSFLVIFYLQTRGLLPPIWNIMQYGPEPKKIICGWECQLNPFAPSLRTTTTIVPLMRGLFEFYAKIFDYKNHVISPLLGLAVIKKNFENPDTLPAELYQYKRHIKQIPAGVLNDPESRVSKWVMDHPSKDVFRYEVPMCIQDPFDLSHNLTKALTNQNVADFKEFCEVSANIIGTKKDNSGFIDNFID